MENKIKTAQATSVEIKRMKTISKELRLLSNTMRDADIARISELLRERGLLKSTCDWSNIEFEENGKKGLKDVEGNILVPAIYDGFGTREDYFTRGFGVIAIKDGKLGHVRCDGWGTPKSDFAYTKMERMWGNIVFLVSKEDEEHFAVMMNGVVKTPYELDEAFVPEDGVMLVKGNGKMGLYDIDLDCYIHPVYDVIYDNGVGEEFTFVKDGVEGKVNYEGLFVADEDYRNMSDEEQEKAEGANGFICGDDSLGWEV